MIEFRNFATTGPLIFFKTCEDCDQFRIANDTSHLLSHHKGHGSNNKDSCSKSTARTVHSEAVLREISFFSSEGGSGKWGIRWK